MAFIINDCFAACCFRAAALIRALDGCRSLEEKKMLVAYRCDFCNSLQSGSGRCSNCNYPSLSEVSMTEREYCEKFGHNSGEIRIPNTKEYDHSTWYRGEEARGSGSTEIKHFSHVYHSKCARCGLETKYRKVDENEWQS
jgi:hypothetical protein